MESLGNYLKIFHNNICSLQGNFDKLDSFLDNLLFSFAIMSLSETWNSKSKTYIFDAGDVSGYQKYIGQTGTTLKSGCGMYISNKINFVPRPDLSTHIYNNNNEFETLWIEVVNENKKNILIGTFYRHPSRKDKSFIDYLEKNLTTIRSEDKTTIITGDFNYDLLKYGNDTATESFFDLFLDNCFQPLIFCPTRIVEKAKPSLLDNIFINNRETNVISGNTINEISDYMPQFSIYKKF